MTLKEQATKNILDIKEILDRLEITFWLEAGTLLGAVRDKDFCTDDEDDIDLSTWENYLQFKEEIVKSAEEIGFTLLFDWELEICLERGGSRVDIFFNRKNGKEAYRHLYSGLKIERYLVVPVKYYEKLGSIIFKGKRFNTPGMVKEYLTIKYGDWRTPINRKDYTFEMDKLLRTEYV